MGLLVVLSVEFGDSSSADDGVDGDCLRLDRVKSKIQSLFYK